MTIRLLFATIFLLFTALACGEEAEERTQTDTTEERVLDYVTTVSFLDHNRNEISEIRAAVADDNRSRSEGLMNVTNLPEDAGMLFIFDDEAQRNFYMANTPISLDIIFVNSEYEIVRIHRNTTPYSSQTIPSEAPAKYVVETNAGYTLRHDISEGDFIRLEEK